MKSNGAVIRYLDQKMYPAVGSNWDDDVFRRKLLSIVEKDSAVLDLGAGSGILPQMHICDFAGVVHGVDTDPSIEKNPALDTKALANANALPFAGDSFHIVFANNVLEHLDEPLIVLTEIARVLKPGGLFAFKTPNRKHYAPLIARLTPTRFHRWVVRGRGRQSEDVFPTRYKANTPNRIRELARAGGLEVISLDLIEGRPEYARIAWPLYLLGIAYERSVNRFEWLSRYRVVIVGILRSNR